MKKFDPNYQMLAEMYQDDYYPDFLVDKISALLRKVIALLENDEKIGRASCRERVYEAV